MDSNSRVCEGSSCFCHANATLPYQEWGEVIRAGGKGQDLPKLRAASCMGRGEKYSPHRNSLSLHFCCCGGHCTGCLICCCCRQGAGATGTCPGTVTTGPWGGRTTTGVTSCTALTSSQTTSSEPWQEEPLLWQELSVLWQPLSPREHMVRLGWSTLGRKGHCQ